VLFVPLWEIKTKNMKQVKINAYQIGLVFKNGVYKKMLKEGNYWLWNKQVYVYDVTKPFTAPIELNILLKDAELANALQVVDVKDNEVVLQYENGLLKQVLTAGRYAYWKSVIAYNFIKADISKIEITEPIERAVLLSKLVAPYVRSITVENYEKAVLLIDGKYAQMLQPGNYYFWRNNISIAMSRVDMRQQQLEVNGQEILTKDKAALRINAWAQYKVMDIEKALLQNKEYDKQLYVAFQLDLREYIAGYNFDELLESRNGIAPRQSESVGQAFIMQNVKEKAEALGVEVNGFGIRDIILPGDVKEIMNHVLVAEKKAQANTIMRREETASTRSLLNTAKLMEENTMLWKLKEMEYVEKIAEKISNISVSGNGVLIEQLKQIFVPQK
jgi:regulator of protease activity HflC (stomatin/prohibitin superfamily)